MKVVNFTSDRDEVRGINHRFCLFQTESLIKCANISASFCYKHVPEGLQRLETSALEED